MKKAEKYLKSMFVEAENTKKIIGCSIDVFEKYGELIKKETAKEIFDEICKDAYWNLEDSEYWNNLRDKWCK